MFEFCVNQRLISARFEIVNIMQGSMNCVAAPYFIGMYWDRLSANACILGCIIGLLVLFVTEFMIYQVRDMATEGWMGSIELLSSFWALFASGCSSIMFTWIFAIFAPHLNNDDNKHFKWDYVGTKEAERFGPNRCNMAAIKEACKDFEQPSDTWLGWGLFVFASCAPWIALPWGKDAGVDEGMIGAFPKWAFDLFIVSVFSGVAILIMNAFCFKPDISGADTKTIKWAAVSGADHLGPAQLARRMSQELLENPDSPFSIARKVGSPSKAGQNFNTVLPASEVAPHAIPDTEEVQ
jgi:hypothetical protein